jgi:hypothetical protein
MFAAVACSERIGPPTIGPAAAAAYAREQLLAERAAQRREMRDDVGPLVDYGGGRRWEEW